MLTSILTKSLRDRWLSTAISALLVSLVLTGALAAYQTIDTSLYTNLPESLRAVMGIPAGADAAVLAYSVMLGMLGALTLAGLAISLGASSVAGEERDGTIGLLLGNPRSRRQLLASKAGSMTLLAALGAGIVLAGTYLAPAIVGADIGSAHLVAVMVHLLANGLLWGALAMAVGAVTGNRMLASASSAGLMVASYFLVGLLPLAASTAGAARWLPWYWFDGHDPLNNGLDGSFLLLQLGAATAFAAIAFWGVEARDLTKPLGSSSLVTVLMDRIRSDERAAKVLDRLGGGARVGSLWTKTIADHQTFALIVAVIMFSSMGLLMGPVYAAIESTLASMSDSLPDAMLAIVGGGDMSTPEGWYRLETFGLMAPIAAILVASIVGAKALAGEEQSRTMGLLLANPVPRRTIVLQKAIAMAALTGGVALATFAGVAGGSLLADLGMDIGNIAATSFQLFLIGLLFGALALAVSAATGSVRSATMATIGTAGTAYIVNSVFSISEDLAAWQRVSPFEWYLGNDPLVHGIDAASVALFAAATLALLTLAVVTFERRDLRRS